MSKRHIVVFCSPQCDYLYVKGEDIEKDICVIKSAFVNVKEKTTRS